MIFKIAHCEFKRILFLLVISVNTIFGNPIIDDVSSTTIVKKYQKFEITFNVKTTAKNLYDENEIDVHVLFKEQNSNKVIKINAFPYQAFKRTEDQTGNQVLSPEGPLVWKCRFSPTQVGTWSFEIIAKDRNGTNNYISSPKGFTVTPSSEHGFIKISTLDEHYLCEEGGRSVFPLGVNLVWIGKNKTHDTFLYDQKINKLYAEGANFIRIWLSKPGFEVLGSKINGNGLDDFNQKNAWELDYIFEKLSLLRMYAQVCIFHFQSFIYENNLDLTFWNNNPLNVKNGGPLTDITSLWESEKAQNYINQNLRYVTARWGYSTALLSYELFNEVNKIAKFDEFYNSIAMWHKRNYDILNIYSPQKHLITTSFSSIQDLEKVFPIWKNLDIVQFHYYLTEDSIAKIKYQLNSTRKVFNKPIIISEFAMDWDWRKISKLIKDDPEGWSLHDSNWLSLMLGYAAGALPWWMDEYIEPQNLFYHWKGISNFLKNEDLDKYNYQSFSHQLEGQSKEIIFLKGKSRILGWVRNLDYYPKENAVEQEKEVSLVLEKLEPMGVWQIEFWDTVSGKLKETQEIEIKKQNTVLSIPILNKSSKDCAFKFYFKN